MKSAQQNLTHHIFLRCRYQARKESGNVYCICVLRVSILSLILQFSIGFWKCSDAVMSVLFFILL